jgi:hypothetical protein
MGAAMPALAELWLPLVLCDADAAWADDDGQVAVIVVPVLPRRIGILAYLATLALSRGADAMAVFRLTTTAALLGYGFTNVMNSIWKGRRWTVTAKFVFDGILDAVCTEFCQRQARALQVSQ